MAKKREKAKQKAGEKRSRTMEDVALYIKKMRFKKRIFGGVDEEDLWKKIERLHKEYEFVFLYQEARLEELEDRLNAALDDKRRSNTFCGVAPDRAHAADAPCEENTAEAEHGEEG